MHADAAYANAAFIPDGSSYPARWEAAAAAFRLAHPPERLSHGPSPRQVVDLFRPTNPKGLLVFVHGGYWIEGHPDMWSHLAAGPFALGWAVAIVGYDLCPDVSIPEITAQVARAVEVAAGAVPGPIHLTGHSAGGHLVARLGCADVDLAVRDRLRRIVPISPVGDLAPLMFTSMNARLRIDAIMALTESPLRRPAPGADVTVWVGAAERPVFLAQAEALAHRWSCRLVIEPDRHHFDVIAGLERADSPLTTAVLGP
ncbi:alpha/beta hydrolase [Flavimaricola marinus]|uniref:Alpha/beta hydrolase fold protein n=1 Tax=Flavimaricola marinus TaxID=1819565 RepID=A0A238L908_9RHOB|nr:alpha/beta hydrolase [Flavimaricola marinus]SMY06169.1 alpha/beta hydrolase fold protein [Flavimaricola marinus]